jgi:hypothetical protein
MQDLTQCIESLKLGFAEEKATIEKQAQDQFDALKNDLTASFGKESESKHAEYEIAY